MIPVFDITRQNKILKKELDQAIRSAIDSGIFILGPKAALFEREFARYLGVKYAVGVASGTDAITLALLGVGIKEGDEVIMPANSYPSVFGVCAAGAVPKLADIDPATFNIDPAKIPQIITEKTKAIMPVHLYGQPAEMERILEIGKKYKIPIVEDCAQAVGAATHTGCVLHTPGVWKKAGSIGDAGCFSFYPTKNLGAFGDGGMVVTNDEEIYKKIKLLRMYGEESRYNSIMVGRNSRLDELQAAILLVKLKHLNDWTYRRRQIAQLYYSHFAESVEVGHGFFAHLPNSASQTGLRAVGVLKKHDLPADSFFHVYHLYVIRTKKRDQLKKYLEEKGIGTAIHYPLPIHLVPSMKFLGYKKGDFPESEKACEEILSLPMYPELADNEVRQIAEAVKSFDD